MKCSSKIENTLTANELNDFTRSYRNIYCLNKSTCDQYNEAIIVATAATPAASFEAPISSSHLYMYPLIAPV